MYIYIYSIFVPARRGDKNEPPQLTYIYIYIYMNDSFIYVEMYKYICIYIYTCVYAYTRNRTKEVGTRNKNKFEESMRGCAQINKSCCVRRRNTTAKDWLDTGPNGAPKESHKLETSVTFRRIRSFISNGPRPICSHNLYKI